MRHRKGNAKLGLPTDQRLALIKNGVLSLFENNSIKTTNTRAKQIAKMAEKLITLGKSDSVHSRRMVYKYVPNRTVVKNIFTEIAPKYKEVSGGNTRITKIGNRKGDNAPISLLELR
jgi:large subunit ribosomal protein L17